MNAERFVGDAEGPEQVINKADDGTTLPDCRGWYCDACGTIFVEKDAAELCCMEPDAVREHRSGSNDNDPA